MIWTAPRCGSPLPLHRSLLTENGDGGDGEISTGDKRADAEGSHSFGLAVDTSTIEGSFAGRQAAVLDITQHGQADASSMINLTTLACRLGVNDDPGNGTFDSILTFTYEELSPLLIRHEL